MSATSASAEHLLDVTGRDLATGRGRGGPAPVHITVAYGFWIFLLSDIVMFSALFAAYAALAGNTNGGPAGRDLFDMSNVAAETICLLVSSYTCGLSALAIAADRTRAFRLASIATFMLGATFLVLEIPEFAGLVARGAGPSRSAFLSGFFALVGLHGLHVTAGLIWPAYMMAQVAVKGLRPAIRRRLHCFSLFWHALDIIWVGLLTILYLMGARA